jgi:hypothetical protein
MKKKSTAMKESTTLLVLMLATVFTGIAASVADAAPATPPGDDASPAIIASTDDGQSSRAVGIDRPKANHPAHLRTRLIARDDADGNGRIDRVERFVMRADAESGDRLARRGMQQHRQRTHRRTAGAA